MTIELVSLTLTHNLNVTHPHTYSELGKEDDQTSIESFRVNLARVMWRIEEFTAMQKSMDVTIKRRATSQLEKLNREQTKRHVESFRSTEQ